MSTRLRCQNSEGIEEVLEDSAMLFYNTRGLAFMRKMVTLHPTWRTVIKANLCFVSVAFGLTLTSKVRERAFSFS